MVGEFVSFDVGGPDYGLFSLFLRFELIRCSVIIVTAILKATLLRESLTPPMWIGIAINAIGQAQKTVRFP